MGYGREVAPDGYETLRFVLGMVCDGVLRTQQRADVIIAKHLTDTLECRVFWLSD